MFDFIHAVQMNFESSQLDKENAHFVLADMVIASAELIKTRYVMENSDILSPYDTAMANGTAARFIPTHQRHASAAPSTKAGGSDGLVLRNRLASAVIRINNQSVTSSNIRSFEDRSNTNSLQTHRDSFLENNNSYSMTEHDGAGGARGSIVSGSFKKFQNRLRTSLSTSSLNSLMKMSSMNNKENLIIAMNRQIFDRNSRTSVDTLVFDTSQQHWLLTNDTVNGNSTASGNSELFDLSIESTSDGVNIVHDNSKEKTGAELKESLVLAESSFDKSGNLL